MTMYPERLRRIEEIYNAALQVLPERRDVLLNEMCDGDHELRSEVESLLSFDHSADNFIDKTPGSLVAEMFSEQEKHTDLAGREINHYLIIKLLGTGGMGEVYLAEDKKLRRKVALKILPPHFSAEVDRKRRFEKEARAVSALNHPNIITIYEIEEAESISFMATEFINGKTLRQRIAEKVFSWQEAVTIAIQVAGALESAHAVGIVHRDIKPANIMIRDDGIVKVLDFGLAKLTAPDSIDVETRDQTAPHRVMGTLSYMSPEQALGEKIDARTDIFGFGVVLYEMLTGELPFAGASDAAIAKTSISKTLPSVCESNSDIPGTLDQIIKHALKKDRNERYQSIADLRTDLKNLHRGEQTGLYDYAFTNNTVLLTDPNKRSSATRSNEGRMAKPGISAVWGVALLFILGLAAGLYWKYVYSGNDVATSFRSVKLDVLTAHGLAQSVAISPDGKYIAYAKGEDDGRQSLWLRQTASAGDTQIVSPGPTKYDFLRFSPDSNSLYSVASEGDEESSLYQMTTLGRNRRKLITRVDSQISFSSDGNNIAFIRVKENDNSIVITDKEGGNERVLRTRKFPEVFGDEVSWSPDGRLIATPTLTRGATYAGGMAVVDVATGAETKIPLKEEKLLRISQLSWVNDGKGLIYSPYAADMGQRYQLRYAAYPSGDVQNVTNDLSSYEVFSMTADSQTIVAVQREYSMGIWLTLPDDFSNTVGINSKTGADDGERGVAWTKDGEIVFVSSEGGAQNIWRMDADGSNPKPLTADYRSGKIMPSLSIGGDLLTYYGRLVDPETKEFKPGSFFLQMDSDGTNVREVVSDTGVAFAAASANKDWVVYTKRADGILRIWKVSLAGGEPVRLTNVDSISPVISPDGRSVAYFIKEKGKPLRLGVVSIDGGDPIKTFELPTTASVDAGIAWNKAGNGILFVNTLGTTSNIWTQNIDGGKPTPLTKFKEFQIAQFALNPEGTRLALARGSRNRNVVLINNIRK